MRFAKDDTIIGSLPCAKKYIDEQALHDYHQLPHLRVTFWKRILKV